MELAGTFVLEARLVGYPAVRSEPFTITPGPVDVLAFATQPPGTLAPSELFSVTLEYRDEFGNLVDIEDEISLTLSCDGPTTFPVDVTTEGESEGGLLVFEDLRVDFTATGCVIEASSPAAANPVLSSTFDVGLPTKEVNGVIYIRLPAGDLHKCWDGIASQPDCDGSEPVEAMDAFWIGETEATAGAYEDCVADGQWNDDGVQYSQFFCTYKSRFANEAYPMNCLTLDQAKDFCAWSGGRLPTEDEWLYAAKAGRNILYPWGDDPIVDGHTLARVGDWGSTIHVKNHPLGMNPWGRYDMVGNVWEFIDDGQGGNTTIGGAFNTEFASFPEAYVTPFDFPWERSTNLGFRCVIDEP